MTPMHELAVTESLLDIAVKHASEQNASQVTDLYLTLGKLASIVDDSVQFYWDIISKDTICEGATIHFQRIPAKLTCLDCQKDFVLDGELTPCPACGSIRVHVVSGDEFFLESIAIEKSEVEHNP